MHCLKLRQIIRQTRPIIQHAASNCTSAIHASFDRGEDLRFLSHAVERVGSGRHVLFPDHRSARRDSLSGYILKKLAWKTASIQFNLLSHQGYSILNTLKIQKQKNGAFYRRFLTLPWRIENEVLTLSERYLNDWKGQNSAALDIPFRPFQRKLLTLACCMLEMECVKLSTAHKHRQRNNSG